MYSLSVTINLPETEFEYDIDPMAMNLGALENAVTMVLQENPEATSFVFVIVRRKD